MSKKTCRNCAEIKEDSEFRNSTDLCKKCSIKSAIAGTLAKRESNRHGQYKGDVVVCETCGNHFTIKETVKSPRRFCSSACKRPGENETKKGLLAMQNLSEEARKLRAEKARNKLTGREARGKAAKGVDNCHAKYYQLKSPNQKLYEFKNLRHFIRTHQHLFTKEELRQYKSRRHAGTFAEASLRNLFSINENGEFRISEWHGWSIGDKSKTPFR